MQRRRGILNENSKRLLRPGAPAPLRDKDLLKTAKNPLPPHKPFFFLLFLSYMVIYRIMSTSVGE
jgi:hypothetical protein